MIRAILALVLGLALGLAGGLAAAQEGPDSALIAEIEALVAGAAQNGPATPPGDGLVPEMPQGIAPDAETQAALQAALRSYYDYRVQGFAHRQDVFAWQLFSSRVIFWMVIFIVLAGLYFSWMQFHAAKDPGQMQTTTIEASKTGFKLSSPVLGVVILVMSLAFFYLYLIHVYPVVDTF